MKRLLYAILPLTLLTPCAMSSESANPLPAVIHGHRLPPVTQFLFSGCVVYLT